MKENKLKFTEEELPPGKGKKLPGKSHSAVRDLPKELSQAAVRDAILEHADDNSGTDAAVTLAGVSGTSERILKEAVRNEQLRQQRKMNADLPKEEGANPVTKFHQRQAMKQSYAARRNGETAEKTAENAANAAEKAAETAEKAAKKAAEFVKEHWKGLLIVGLIVLMLLFLLDVFSACSMLFEGAGTIVTGSTYAAADEEITGAEEAYCAMEDDLRRMLDEYEDTHDYDEYIFDLDEIGHDPYVLTSILSALHPGEWTLADVRDTLDLLFEKQYDLSEGLTFETRMRTEPRTGEITLIDPDTGELIVVPYDYEEEVPYHYVTCTVTLINNNLSHVVYMVLAEMKSTIKALNADKNDSQILSEPRKLNSFDEQIEALENEKLKLYEEYQSGGIDLKSYKAQKERIDGEIQKIRSASVFATAQAKEQGEKRNQQALMNELAEAEHLTQSLVDAYIDRVYVFPDGMVAVEYRE